MQLNLFKIAQSARYLLVHCVLDGPALLFLHSVALLLIHCVTHLGQTNIRCMQFTSLFLDIRSVSHLLIDR